MNVKKKELIHTFTGFKLHFKVAKQWFIPNMVINKPWTVSYWWLFEMNCAMWLWLLHLAYGIHSTFSVHNRIHKICWNMLVMYDAWQDDETSAAFSGPLFSSPLSPVSDQREHTFYNEGFTLCKALKYTPVSVVRCETFIPQFFVLVSTLLISRWTHLSCGLTQAVCCFLCEDPAFILNLHKSGLLFSVECTAVQKSKSKSSARIQKCWVKLESVTV